MSVVDSIKKIIVGRTDTTQAAGSEVDVTLDNLPGNKNGVNVAPIFNADMQGIVPLITRDFSVVPGHFLFQWVIPNFFRVAGGSEKINGVSVADLVAPGVQKPGFDIWFSGAPITVTNTATGDNLVLALDQVIKKQKIISVYSGSQYPANLSSGMEAGGFSVVIKNKVASRDLHAFGVANASWDIKVAQFNIQVGRDG